MNEKIITLIVLAAIAAAYWGCSMYKKGGCKLEDLFVLLITIVGATTGLYIFWGAIKAPDWLSRDAIWGGLVGVCITLYSLERIIAAFRCLFVREIAPLARENSQSESTRPKID